MSIKKFFLAAVALSLLALPVLMSTSFVARAEPNSQGNNPTQRTITVTGTGIAYGKPDVVTVGLGVDSVNEDITAAMNDVNERLGSVLQSLQKDGVAPEDIRTENYSISQDYSTPPTDVSGNAQPRRYDVSSSVSITVRKPDQLGQLLADAVQAGANMVNYIQWDIADRTSLESDARSKAVDDATARANALASLLGVTVGEPITIIEGSYQQPIPYGMGGGGGAVMAASVPPISQGQLSVSMVVTVTYAIQ